MRRWVRIHVPEAVSGRAIAVVVAGLVATATLAAGIGASPARSAARDDVKILTGPPTSLDPAAQGDIASAAVTAQLYESLTAFDPGLTLRPALAASWSVSTDGLTITFTLRDGITFSDGTPITAADVVRSWLRVLDPSRPSPLASLVDGVDGAVAYRTGASTAASSVGFRAVDDRTVEVRLEHPESDFPAVVASPTFGVVPPGFGGEADATSQPVSGAYHLVSASATTIVLGANERYWAGRAAIGTVDLVTDIGGRSPVDAFTAGDVDYTPIAGADATWIAYDRTLGPDLRSVPSLEVTYYGFDASRPPFDDVRVRRAFAQAVDWRRLGALTEDESSTPANSMVPPGVPGRSDADFVPPFDPAAAKAELAAAGYPGGDGFPVVTMLTGGTGDEEAIATELHDRLGVTVNVETMAFEPYFERLETDVPQLWALSWVADYPGPNDFLGLLLGTGRTADYGHWTSAPFDAAIADALAASDPAAARAAYDRAETIVRDDAPVVPLRYDAGWALARDGLLGAGQNGLGFLRLAGLTWGG